MTDSFPTLQKSRACPTLGILSHTVLKDAPELINQDPYGKGWLAGVELTDWEADKAKLLDADAYYALIKRQAEEEMKKK